jgi:hypothetical protein
LNCSTIHDDIAPVMNCLTEPELKVSGLVAAESQASQVVSLDEDLDAQKF